MGNFEKLSVLVIVVIIVMILVVALYTWTDTSEDTQKKLASGATGAGALTPGTPADPDPLEEWQPIFNPEDEEQTDPGTSDPGRETDIVDPPAPPLPAVDGPPESDPAPTPADEPQEGPWEYKVKDGDTISQICERELGSWRRQKEVMALNPGLDPLKIRAGDVLKMPARGAGRATPSNSSTRATPEAESVPASGKITTGDWYVVQRGDRLSGIAKRAYGSIDRWPELWARNLSVVKDPEFLEDGLRIYIPR